MNPTQLLDLEVLIGGGKLLVSEPLLGQVLFVKATGASLTTLF